jgi:tetratricopeptide (TPR) repeat protein
MSPRRIHLVTGVLALAVAFPLMASPREMPITTSSAEARQIYVQARDKADNLELEAAAELAERAIALDPDFAMAYLLRAETIGGYPGFSRNLDKAVSLADKVSPGEQHWIRARKAQADGDGSAVRMHLAALATLFPDDEHVLLRLAGYQAFTVRNWTQAAVHLRKATARAPSFAPAYNLLGYAEMALGDEDRAEASFKKYLSLLPDRPNPYDSYAEMLMKAGRYDESIAQYRKALEKDAGFVSSLAGIGTNQMFERQYDAARETFEQERAKAADLDGQLDAMANIATSYVHEGKTGDAVGVFAEIASRAREAQRAERAVGAHLDAAFVLTEAGKPDAALQHVEEARTALKDETVPPPLRARLESAAALSHARVLAAQGQFDAARGELATTRPAIEERQLPGEIQRLNEVSGFVALRQKHYKEALALLQKGNGQSPYVLYQRAVASERLGQTTQASALFDKVATWNANDLGYAIVRSDAIEKADAMAVATKGRKRRP